MHKVNAPHFQKLEQTVEIHENNIGKYPIKDLTNKAERKMSYYR